LSSAESAAASGDAATAITQAKAAVDAATEVGYAETANTTALRTAASNLDTATDDTAELASESTTSNAETEEAFEEAAEAVGMTVSLGTVRFNIKTGELMLDGKPMAAGESAEIVEQCRELLGPYF